MVQIWILGNVTVNLIKLIQLFRLSPVAKSIEKNYFSAVLAVDAVMSYGYFDQE